MTPTDEKWVAWFTSLLADFNGGDIPKIAHPRRTLNKLSVVTGLSRDSKYLSSMTLENAEVELFMDRHMLVINVRRPHSTEHILFKVANKKFQPQKKKGHFSGQIEGNLYVSLLVGE